MKAKILKKITLSNGTVLNSGDIVDVSTWRNAKSLAAMRHISFVTEEKELVEVPLITETEVVAEEISAPQTPRVKKTATSTVK